MPGEARGDVALDRLQGVVGVGAGERVKDGADARERMPLRSSAAMVFSKLGARRRRDGLDFGFVLGHRASKAGRKWPARCGKTAELRTPRSIPRKRDWDCPAGELRGCRSCQLFFFFFF